MLLMILRVAYLLICAGAILAYITSDTDQSDRLTSVVVNGEKVMTPRRQRCCRSIVRNNKAIAFFTLARDFTDFHGPGSGRSQEAN